jgi:hypothetical protein
LRKGGGGLGGATRSAVSLGLTSGRSAAMRSVPLQRIVACAGNERPSDTTNIVFAGPHVQGAVCELTSIRSTSLHGMKRLRRGFG